MIVKYAPTFSDTIDWDAYQKSQGESRKQLSVKIKNDLKAFAPGDHNELCGALNLIRIAARSRKIRQHIHTLLKRSKGISSKHNHERLNCKLTDGNFDEPTNEATWFCIHEEDLRNEWDSIKQFALAEEQRYYNWTWYQITTPTKSASNADITEFENALKGIFEREKDDKDFAAKARFLAESKNFIRYCVSTAKDPIETFLARNGNIEPGNDPTANTFLIDHYFKCNMMRIAFPDVIDSDRVAELFAKFALGCEITQEEPRVFLKAMRRFSTRNDSDPIIKAAKEKFSDVKDIKLKAIRFTIAESEQKADERRKDRENQKRTSCGLPPLPRLRCEVFENSHLYDEVERCFSKDAQRKELIDVYELVFKISIFDDKGESYLSPEMRSAAANANTYTLTVTPQKLRFNPALPNVSNDRHRDILKALQMELKFINEPVSEVIAEEAK